MTVLKSAQHSSLSVIGGGIIAAIINAFIGAVILLLLLRLIRRAA
jgi:uncharacterized membrane protein YeaQ/YmgE (transglycosylase-associated protein family)